METAEKKKSKMGRPVKPVKKETILRLRCDRNEHFVLRQKAQKAGLSISAFLRQAALGMIIKARLTSEERDLVRKLVGMSGNLNQLVKECKKAGIPRTAAHFEVYRDKIDELLHLLRNDQ